MPTASNLNFRRGDTVPNAVLAKVGVDGKVCVFTFAATHLIVDVNGYAKSADGTAPLLPSRLLDTRASDATIDGIASGLGVIGGGTIVRVPVANRGGVPVSGVGAVALNLDPPIGVLGVGVGGAGGLVGGRCRRRLV